MYLLTNCAACAAPLALDAPVCVRCRTRYCDANCQQDHWRRGHKQMCKKIHRGGNAEQYYVDKKYKEAVAEAVEACAEVLRKARDEQLDWCIDDLTPATFHACGPGLLLESSTDSEDADAATAS